MGAAEAAEIKSLAEPAQSGDGFDFSKLSSESLSRLNALYTSINNKVVYAMPASGGMKAIDASGDSAANTYIEEVNSKLAATVKQLDNVRLTAFVKSFA